MKFQKQFAIAILSFTFVGAQVDITRKPSLISKYEINDQNYPEKTLESLNLWQYEFPEHRLKRMRRSFPNQVRKPFMVEKTLCDSKASYLRPQKLKNDRNVTRTIVNHRNYTQVIRFESCSSENFPCTFEDMPKFIASHCEQRYAPMQLLALDETRNLIVTEKFLIPSSCDCLIAQGDLLKGGKPDQL